MSTEDRPVELLITGRIASLDGPSGIGWVEALAVSGGRVVAGGGGGAGGGVGASRAML